MQLTDVGPSAAIHFAGTGAMRGQCRAFDWSTTPLGAVDAWPESLRTASAMMLGSAFPMILLWGPTLVQIYNDAYIPFLAAKHPSCLGTGLYESVTYRSSTGASAPFRSTGKCASSNATVSPAVTRS